MFRARLGVQGRVEIPVGTSGALTFLRRALESEAQNNNHLLFFASKSLSDLCPAQLGHQFSSCLKFVSFGFSPLSFFLFNIKALRLERS